MGKLTSFREPGRRYPALRVIVFFCTLIGAILASIGVCMLIYGLYAFSTGVGWAAPPPNLPQFDGPQVITNPITWRMGPGFFIYLLWSLGILVSGLQLIAWGAFFQLMIHVEENTRASAQMLDRLRTRLDASPEGSEAVFRS